MGFEFNNHQDLFGIIRSVNDKYYKPACENIFYLEELCNENAIAYMTSLRNAYSHLVNALGYEDILAQENKITIIQHLTLYSDHLELLLLDTFQKIIGVKSKELYAAIPEKDKPAVRTQLAMEIKRLRIADDEITTEEKIDGYSKAIDFIEDTFNKLC